MFAPIIPHLPRFCFYAQSMSRIKLDKTIREIAGVALGNTGY
jgi:hypothetical protein